MASKSTTLYVGVTNDLERRVWEHKNRIDAGFTKKYYCNNLVFFETFSNITDAIAREKQIKKWRRQKKVWLINQQNHMWLDLAEVFEFKL